MVKLAFAEFTKGCTCPPDFPICVCGKTPDGKLVSKKVREEITNDISLFKEEYGQELMVTRTKINPVIGVHSGPGVFGVAFYANHRQEFIL